MKGKLNVRNKVITVKTEKMFLELLVKENQTKILNTNFTNDDPQISPVRMRKVVVGTRSSFVFNFLEDVHNRRYV